MRLSIMRVPTTILAFILISTGIFSRNIDSLPWVHIEHKQFDLFYTRPDSTLVPAIARYTENGMKEAALFFDKKYHQKLSVYIFPDRSSLTDQWRKDWQQPDFTAQCWMVASGIASRLDMLSPRTWKMEACDHPGDSTEVRQVILHELVHVLHAQQNPRPDFAGMENVDWLVEGLATYASGQLTNARIQRIKQAIKTGQAPASFAEFWKGSDKYGKAGSFIFYLDQRFGRQKIAELMAFTDSQKILNCLGFSEKQLVDGWVDFIMDK